MAKSTKSYLLELRDFSSEVEEIENKTINYKDNDYSYVVSKYTMFKDYYSVEVFGGPFKIRATTTCNGKSIKKRIKMLIESLRHK